MGFTPRRTISSFERVTFPLGENVMTLTSIEAYWNAPDWKPEGELTFMMVWKDADGDEHTEFPKAPKGLGYNEKATFWNRVAALAGKTGFGDDDFDENGDLASVSLEMPGMEKYQDGDPIEFFCAQTLQDARGQWKKDERGKNIRVPIDVHYRNESLIGKQCRLVMGEKRDKDGNVQEGNKVAQNGALPLGTGTGKKKSGTPSAAAMP